MTDTSVDDGAERGEILVVDDQEANRILLTEILGLEGYPTRVAANGREALAAIAACEPDLVLLDVNMPEMNGFDVCRALRAAPATATLPIILVTALGHREHRLEGIAAGANDYLTKPIDRPDLLLRVRNAIRLRRLNRQVADQYALLQRTEQLRDSLVHMLVHDLRSPLTAMIAYLDVIRTVLTQQGDAEVVADVEEVEQSARTMAGMINDVLDVSRLEQDALPLKLVDVDLRRLVLEAIGRRGGHAAEIPVSVEAASDQVWGRVDTALMRRVVGNLVGNAIKFTPPGAAVRVVVARTADGPVIEVIDSGPGIPAEYHERIFEKFGTVEGGRAPGVASSGLGLTFCRMVVEAHHGTIGVTSAPEAGSTFRVTLPAPVERAL